MTNQFLQPIPHLPPPRFNPHMYHVHSEPNPLRHRFLATLRSKSCSSVGDSSSLHTMRELVFITSHVGLRVLEQHRGSSVVLRIEPPRKWRCVCASVDIGEKTSNYAASYPLLELRRVPDVTLFSSFTPHFQKRIPSLLPLGVFRFVVVTQPPPYCSGPSHRPKWACNV